MEGKVAIVTGGAKGIGYAIVQRFLQDGARVVIADIDEKSGEAAVADLSDLGEVEFVLTDVSQRLDVRNLLAATLDTFGDVDVMVNNAGIAHEADFLELTEADFERVMAVNVKGAFLCGQAAARNMIEAIAKGADPGCIINISSINAVVGLPQQVPYTVSKGGVAQLTRVMALSLAQHGIRVNAVGPGSIMTGMLASVVNERNARDRILSRTPLGRIGDPAEIAGVAAFLASKDAAYVTGQTIFADGGRLPLNYTVDVPET